MGIYVQILCKDTGWIGVPTARISGMGGPRRTALISGFDPINGRACPPVPAEEDAMRADPYGG